jgi:hypothetical protein
MRYFLSRELDHMWRKTLTTSGSLETMHNAFERSLLNGEK